MKKASEFLRHAQECRALAAGMDSEEQRALMLQMADHWERLAADRGLLVARNPDLAVESESDAEGQAPANPDEPPVGGRP